MKKSRQLQNLVRKLSLVSFKDNKMIESQVIKSIKLLKSLPLSQSILSLSEYLQQLKRRERTHAMYIETVIPLTISQIKKVKTIVEKRVKITKVLTNINPQILGGFRLQVGDEIWDETILGKINQVKEVISG